MHQQTRTQNNNPLVTFALFAFNHERYIEEAVNAALAQQYEALQIIISDDASSDATYRKVVALTSGYRGRHELIHMQNEQNLGIGRHVNKVLELARGELIVLAAGDDISAPDRVQQIVECWNNSGQTLDAIWSSIKLIDENGRPMGFTHTDPSPLGLGVQVREMVPSLLGCSHATTKRLYRKFGPLRDGICYEDRALAFRALLAGGMASIRKPLVSYRQHGGSVTYAMQRLSDLRAKSVLHQRRLHLQRAREVLVGYSEDLQKLDEEDVSPKEKAELFDAIAATMNLNQLENELHSASFPVRVRALFKSASLPNTSKRQRIEHALTVVSPLGRTYLDLLGQRRRFLTRRFRTAVDDWALRTALRLASLSQLSLGAVRRLLKLKGLDALTVKPYETGAVVLRTIAPETPSVSVPPHGSMSESVTAVFPPIQARLFKDATIHCHSSAILQRDGLLVPAYHHQNRARFNYAAGHLKLHDLHTGIVEASKASNLKHGIALFGLGSFNWYHWLIEILPTAMLAQELPEEFKTYPLLVPDSFDKYEAYRASLEIFRRGQEIITLDNSRQYHVDELVLIDSPVHGPFNLRDGEWPTVRDYEQNAKVLADFRSRILANLCIPARAPSELVFLARENTLRAYNQDELAEIAQEYGFKVVSPEKLSFRQQVETFNSARCVIGASGAGLANLLFCQRGSKCLTWLFNEYKEFCAYSNLASIGGIQLSSIFHSGNQELAGSGSAYEMGYRIEPQLFRQKLDRLVDRP